MTNDNQGESLPEGYFPSDEEEARLLLIGSYVRPGVRLNEKPDQDKHDLNNPKWAEHVSLLTRGYWAVYERPIKERAQELGYAIAIHGSLLRDIDLIACPWTETAVDAETLKDAVVKVVNGFIPERQREPSQKPHGRLVWTIHIGGGSYIDLSVMPRT